MQHFKVLYKEVFCICNYFCGRDRLPRIKHEAVMPLLLEGSQAVVTIVYCH